MIRVLFGPASDPVVVEAETEALAHGVRELFRSRVLDRGPEPSEVGPAHLTVLGGAGHYRLLEPGAESQGGEETFATLPDLMSAVEFAILRRLIQGAGEFTRLHASGVVVEGRAIVALGESGAGKSSLALAWSRMGLPLLGDDALLLDDRGEVHAFPRLMKVDRGRLEDHGLKLDSTVAPDPDHPEAWVEVEEGGGWWRGSAPVGILAHIRYDGGEQTRTTDLGAVETLRVLIASTLGAGEPPEASMDRYLAAMEGALMVGVSFGSAVDTAGALVDLATQYHTEDPIES